MYPEVLRQTLAAETPEVFSNLREFLGQKRSGVEEKPRRF